MLLHITILTYSRRNLFEGSEATQRIFQFGPSYTTKVLLQILVQKHLSSVWSIHSPHHSLRRLLLPVTHQGQSKRAANDLTNEACSFFSDSLKDFWLYHLWADHTSHYTTWMCKCLFSFSYQPIFSKHRKN